MEGDARQIASVAEDSANSRSCCVLWRFPCEVVGATGFEPATPCAQGRCATRLRYAPTLEILNFTAVSRSSPVRVLAFLAKIVPELSQNPIHCPRTPDSSSDLSQNARRFVGHTIELLQRLALHLQLHLRDFLKTLASPWRRSCVAHSSATPPALRRVA